MCDCDFRMVIHIEGKRWDMFLRESLRKVISDFIFEIGDSLYSPAIDGCLDNFFFLFFKDGRSMEKFSVVIFQVEPVTSGSLPPHFFPFYKLLV